MAEAATLPARRASGTLRARLSAWRQWPRETRDTLFQLALITWIVIPHLGHLAGWCAALTAVVLLWRAQLAITGGPLPGRWKVMALLAVAVGLTVWTERTLLGREAGVTLLVVLMGLKTLELRARRDAMVVFFLGFFLVLTDCLYSQSLLTALAMLIATWGLLTALVLANMPVGKPPLWRAGLLAARSALLGLPLMAALFLLFPRFGPLWGLPQDSGGRTGLSGTLRLGGVADLARDETIAFRVRFEGEGPPSEALYFRGPVLSRFDGVEWLPSVFVGARNPNHTAELRTAGAPVRYEMMLEPIRLALLPLLEATPDDAASAPQLPDWTLWLGHDLQWHTDRLVGERLRFRAQAWPRFAHGQRTDEAELASLRQLPPGYNPRTIAWAQQMRAQLGDVDARTLAAALQAHIRQANYVYTLQPGSYGSDAIDEFWLDRRQGFCEHFATAWVVVMRALGVPARVVTGYQGAEEPDADGFRIVRQSHAHAWAEYWMAGAGWQRIDPTAAVAPERVRASRALQAQPGFVAGAFQNVNPALATQLRRAWELLDSRWNQWVMGYSRSRQFDLLRQLGVHQPDWADLAKALMGLLSAAALAGAAWAWLDKHRQDPWLRLQGRLARRLQQAGINAQPHHPPRTLAALVRQQHGAAGEALARALETLDQQRYAPGGQRLPDRHCAATAEREASRLRGAQRAHPATATQAPG
jgi:transglutaminase-like putative cysteine protease